MTNHERDNVSKLAPSLLSCWTSNCCLAQRQNPEPNILCNIQKIMQHPQAGQYFFHAYKMQDARQANRVGLTLDGQYFEELPSTRSGDAKNAPGGPGCFRDECQISKSDVRYPNLMWGQRRNQANEVWRGSQETSMFYISRNPTHVVCLADNVERCIPCPKKGEKQR